jgi:hypothetical protein
LIFCVPSPSRFHARFPFRFHARFRLRAMSRSDHEALAFVDTHVLRIRCSLILSLCFPCAVFKMRIRILEPSPRDPSKRYSLRD